MTTDLEALGRKNREESARMKEAYCGRQGKDGEKCLSIKRMISPGVREV